MEKITIVLPPVASSDIENDLYNLTEYLTKKIFAGQWQGGGLLGGEFGYGVDYKNEVFAMNMYYWGECTCGWDEMYFDEEHEADCYQSLVDKELIDVYGWKKDKDGVLQPKIKMTYDQESTLEDGVRKKYCKQFGLTFPAGCAVHCTCTHTKRLKDWYEKNKKGKEGHADDCPTVLPNFKHFKSGFEIRWYKYIGRDMEYKKINPDKWRKIFQECIDSVEHVDTQTEKNISS